MLSYKDVTDVQLDLKERNILEGLVPCGKYVLYWMEGQMYIEFMTVYTLRRL